ncbi:MAG: hypothetical protein L0206_21960 [Actinobacteria bacterium]|nr:hypothetical protein [Actinomycetota bacterium]
MPESEEEARLRTNAKFRALVLAGYVALGAVAVRGEGPPEEVVAGIRKLVETGSTS